MKKLLIFFFCAFILNYAQDAKSIIKNIQTKFGTIQDLTANVSQNSSKSIFYYQKENKYRIESAGSTIVSDGQRIWNHNKKTNKVVISMPHDQEMAYTINNLVYSFPEQSKIKYEGKEKIGSENCDVVTMIPSGSNRSFDKIKIWSDRSHLIRRANITDASGVNLVFEFSNIKINTGIPDSRFSFEPPKGSEIIDLR